MAVAVQSAAFSTEPLNTTSHDVPIPAGTTSGDLLIAIAVIDGTSGSETAPSGWSALLNVDESTGTHRVIGWYKTAGASESATTFTTAASEKSTTVVYRIDGQDSGTAPEAATAEGAGDTSPGDPPNLAPSWGSEETLWIAFVGLDTADEPTGAPSGYANLATDSAGGSTGTGYGIAYKVATSSSDNPGAFTGGSSEWCAATIAVRPDSGGGGTPAPPPSIGQQRRRFAPLLSM